ncbi:HepT-like ribonuclease domain-containing protein [Pseudaminobacter soli (ex Zhang et al. 2022)]|nr:HepT-like ribonuclease domain-containing protein [Pseudaminobacter soli]
MPSRSSASEREFRAWLADIVAWGERIALYTNGMNQSDFMADQKTQDAVVRCIECIGEASKRILESGSTPPTDRLEFLQAYWTRNRLAHGYYDVNAERVWVSATESVPKLVANVKAMLHGLE